jgi:hypothetical protein
MEADRRNMRWSCTSVSRHRGQTGGGAVQAMGSVKGDWGACLGARLDSKIAVGMRVSEIKKTRAARTVIDALEGSIGREERVRFRLHAALSRNWGFLSL